MKRLREACAWVMDHADHVRIREGEIPPYTRRILERYTVITGHDEHHLVTDDPEQTASYFLALNSINFGSGYFRATGLEYRDVAGGLKKAFLRGEMDTAEKWAAATAGECFSLFVAPGPTGSTTLSPSPPAPKAWVGEGRGEGGGTASTHPAHSALASPPPHPNPLPPLASLAGERELSGQLRTNLLSLFARHLAATGRIMQARYASKTLNLISAAGGSAEKLAEITGEWTAFRDIAAYKGRDIPFLKRAQLLAAHLELTGIPKFRDMDALTCFADNMIPHVLRCDGLLEYAPALARKIEAGIPLEAGSAEEVELRAASVHAVELMRADAAREGHILTAPNIDHLLWNRGYEPEIFAHSPHRTLTVWY